jgi:hypothetical protein
MNYSECLTGKQFGHLKVVGSIQSELSKNGRWIHRSLCACSCGTTTIVRNTILKNGDLRSCGCRKRIGNLKHGHSRAGSSSRTYRAYSGMIQRCTNPHHDGYKNYGGSGVKVCARWLDSFQNFLDDVGECPEGLEIDRINSGIGYEPGNVRLANEVTQSRNRRTALMFTVHGVTACLSELCERYGVGYGMVFARLKRGWTIDRALTYQKK